MAIISIFAGAIGWLIRRTEIATVFDPISGLAERGAMITILLIVLSVAVTALLFGLSFTVPKGRNLSTFTNAFGGSLFITIPLTLLGLVVLVLTGLEALSLLPDGMDGFAAVRLGGAALSGLCLMLTAVLGHRGINVALPATVPVFWLCAWLIVSHIDRAADPVLLGYVYNLFTKAALLLALYYIAGYAFRQHRPGRLMFASSTAIFFTGVTMGDNLDLYTRGTFLALAATVLIYQIALTKNLNYNDWKDIPYMERDM